MAGDIDAKVQPLLVTLPGPIPKIQERSHNARVTGAPGEGTYA